MKAEVDGPVVLSAAERAAADAGAKAMMPIAGRRGPTRPLLDFTLSRLADAGYRQVVLVVGPDAALVRDYYDGVGRPTRMAVSFAVQGEPRGTADAVLAAQEAVGDRPFAVVNGDNVYPVAALEALRTLGGPGLAAFERDDLVDSSGISPDRVASFAVLDVTPDGRLAGVVEKPSAEAVASRGARALVSMNCWRFDARIFDACRDTPPSVRGELELTAAVRLAVERGVAFRVAVVKGPVFDLSRRSDIAFVSARLAEAEVRP
jgi:dTDP-glucose pyrophosphorylase